MGKYDVLLPIGEDCCPALGLKACGLRKEAYPLDWMIFDAPAMIHLFRTGFSDFFVSVAEEEGDEANRCRYIRDTANNILSIHHFPKDREVSDMLEGFRNKMHKRYRRLHRRLMDSSALLMLGYREDTLAQVKNTLYEFAALYPHLSIHLVNVSESRNMPFCALRQENHPLNDRLKISICYTNSLYGTINQRCAKPEEREALWRRVIGEYCS